jgi:hypothetical protein
MLIYHVMSLRRMLPLAILALITLYRGPIDLLRSALDILTEIRTGKWRIMVKNATIRILKRKTSVGDYRLSLGLARELEPRYTPTDSLFLLGQ